MKKLKFGIQVGVLALAFPLLFVVGITHVGSSSIPEVKTDQHPVAEKQAGSSAFVYNSRLAHPIMF